MMKKVLIVEDDETVAELLKFIIEQEGFQPELSTNGLNAIQHALSSKPDLIILDLALPRKSGFEVIKTLSEKNANIPIIIVTGKFTDEKARRELLIEKNVKDVIIKPIRPPYLIYKLHQIFGTQPKTTIKEELEFEF